MAFIERSKSGSTNVVVFKYAALYYWLMWPTIIVSLANFAVTNTLLIILSLAMWVVLIGIAAPYWPTMAELKTAMRQKSLRASGSKYSFSNPLRYEWED
jgi:hypothetical protein